MGNNPRFNLALRPADAATNAAFVQAAQTYAGTADGYLLGDNALPHLTLCQFRAPSEETAREAYQSWADRQALSLVLARLWSKPGSNEHEGTWWPEIEVEHSAELMALQKSCCDHLRAKGFEILTPAETYRPHFTLARCSQPLAEPLVRPEALPAGKIVFCHTDLGTCSENGVFVKSILTPPRNFTK